MPMLIGATGSGQNGWKNLSQAAGRHDEVIAVAGSAHYYTRSANLTGGFVETQKFDPAGTNSRPLCPPEEERVRERGRERGGERRLPAAPRGQRLALPRGRVDC